MRWSLLSLHKSLPRCQRIRLRQTATHLCLSSLTPPQQSPPLAILRAENDTRVGVRGVDQGNEATGIISNIKGISLSRRLHLLICFGCEHM
mmetsp:Transcript_26113/g.54045  ORF Transcript_26113/g.54045 Transcript_26113/m.54045 type:complete len:91 (-) Transcript_26113:24-296(-)